MQTCVLQTFLLLLLIFGKKVVIEVDFVILEVFEVVALLAEEAALNFRIL